MNLAIKGHLSRGNEVIEILEMLGGINVDNLYGDDMYSYYYITDDKEIDSVLFKYSDDKARIFTLEDFLAKFPYKVGDKVYNIIHNENQTITDLAWDSKENEVVYQTNNNEYVFVNYIQPYKEETMENNIIDTVKESEGRYRIVLNHKFDMEVDEGEYYAVRRKPQYPKTYEECCKVLGADPSRIIVLSNRKDIIHEENKHCFEMYNLYQLLICRDAYWRMAGDWKYDVNKIEDYFLIVNKCGRIVKEHYMSFNHILAFPTAEMRDAFFNNFKDLIEECKELL